MIVTFLARRVGTFHRFLIALQGHGGLTHVAVGTAQQVVGTHPFVGRAMAVVIVRHLFHYAVGSEIDVCLVLRICKKQFIVHAVGLPGSPHRIFQLSQNQQGGIRMIVHHCLSFKQGFPVLLSRSTRQEHKEDNGDIDNTLHISNVKRPQKYG